MRDVFLLFFHLMPAAFTLLEAVLKRFEEILKPSPSGGYIEHRSDPCCFVKYMVGIPDSSEWVYSLERIPDVSDTA
jgi:hypothetical protein